MELCVFKADLVYRVSSRTVRIVLENLSQKDPQVVKGQKKMQEHVLVFVSEVRICSHQWTEMV